MDAHESKLCASVRLGHVKDGAWCRFWPKCQCYCVEGIPCGACFGAALSHGIVQLPMLTFVVIFVTVREGVKIFLYLWCGAPY